MGKGHSLGGRFQVNGVRSTSHSTNRRRSSLLALAALSSAGMYAVSSRPANAQLYWDLNGATSGANGASPNGQWNLTSNDWTIDPLGLSATTVPWSGGTTPVQAIFSAGTNATGAYTVTVAPSTVIPGVNGIAFNFGSVSLVGGDANSAITLTAPTITTDTNGLTNLGVNIQGSAGMTLNVGTASTTTVGGNNTFTGNVLIQSSVATSTTSATYTINGRVVPTSNTAFGNAANPVSFDARESTIASTAGTNKTSIQGLGINLTGGMNIANPLTINGGNNLAGGLGELNAVSGTNVWSGPITIDSFDYAASTAAYNGSIGSSDPDANFGTLVITQGLTFASGKTGSTGGSNLILSAGDGTIILAGSGSYSGGVTSGGIIRPLSGNIILAANNAIPANSGGFFMSTTTGTGTTSFDGFAPLMVGLQAPAGQSITAPGFGQISGVAPAGHGLVDNLSGNNTIAGGIVLYNTAPYNVNNTTLTQLAIPNPVGVTADSLTVTGAIVGNNSTNQRSLVKTGAGLLNLTSASNSFTGPTIIEGGTLSLSGQGQLLVNGVTGTPQGDAIQVNPGASFRWDDSSQLISRINTNGNALSIVLVGGDFSIVGNSTQQQFNNSIGSEVDLYGNSSVTLSNPGSAGQIFEPNDFFRGSADTPVNSTVVFRGATLGTGPQGNNVSSVFLPGSFTSSLITTGTGPAIIPWVLGDASVTGNGTDFVTYDGSNGMRLLTAGEYAAVGAGGNALDTAPGTTVLNTPLTDNAIKFGAGAGTLEVDAPYTVNSGAILNASGSAITINGSAPVQFGGAEGIIYALNDVVVNAQLSGTGGLTKGGNANLTLTNTSNNFGTLTINGGNVIADANAELGSGNTIVFNGGSLQPTSTLTSLDISHPIQVASLGGFNVGTGQTLTVGNNISGIGTFTKSGGGELVLTNNNIGFFGALSLQGGTIDVDASNELGSGTTGLTLGGATGQNGESTNSIANNSGEIRFEGGSIHIVNKTGGTNTTKFFFGLPPTGTGGGSFDNRMSGGNMYFAGDGTINVDSGEIAQQQHLMFGPGDLVKTGGGTLLIDNEVYSFAQNFLMGERTSILGGTLGYTNFESFPHQAPMFTPDYFYLDTGGTLQLFFTDTGSYSLNRGITIGSGGGNIDVDELPNGGSTITFTQAAAITGGGTLGKVGLGTLVLSNLSNSYTGGTDIMAGAISIGSNTAVLGLGGTAVTLDGGTLLATAGVTLNRPIVVTANNGTIQINSSAINDATFTTTGVGTLNKIGAGTFTVKSFAVGGVNIQAGTILAQASNSTNRKINVIGTPTSAGVFNMSASTNLNLEDNDLIWNYGTTRSATNNTEMHTLLAQGYAADAWNGVGSAAGGAINSGSLAANNANAAKPKLGFGYADAGDLGLTIYRGQSLATGAIVVRYTYEGDANLDGTVNALDFNLLATGYGQGSATVPANWDQGDFDYSGTVDSNDFAIMAANYNQSAALSGDLPDDMLPADDSVAMASSLGSVVPEPTTLSLLGIATLGLMARRRRGL